MGQTHPPKRKYTITEWLALERTTGERYEYHDGEVYLMAGGTLRHTVLCSNTMASLVVALGDSPCIPLTSEAKIEVKAGEKYVYPDTVVVCGEIAESEVTAGAILNPTVVFEVISGSSESYDSVVKSRYYRSLRSVMEYVIIEQEAPAVTIMRRIGNGDMFKIFDVQGLDGSFELQSLDVTLTLGDLYRRVEFL